MVLTITEARKHAANTRKLTLSCEQEFEHFVNQATTTTGQYVRSYPPNSKSIVLEAAWDILNQSPHESDRNLAKSLAEYILHEDFIDIWKRTISRMSAFYENRRSDLENKMLRQAQTSCESTVDDEETNDDLRSVNRLLLDMFTPGRDAT